ncbi:hypothetical protein TKK_0014783 [Trichogramma kaykai]
MYSRGRTPGDSTNYQKQRFGRAKKREKIFMGNRSRSPIRKGKSKTKASTSAKKIQEIKIPIDDVQYRIIDINILFPMLERALCCVTCKGKVKLSEQSIRGLGFQINVKCSDCQRELSVDSSQKIGTMSNAYEINRRSVLMIRALGHGHTGLETLCGLMDTLPPVTQSHFDTINSQLCQASKSVADFSMREAVKEELNATEGEEGLTVSGDGSWRKRGFSSLQGVSTIIGNQTKKVLDVSIKNKYCPACNSKKNLDKDSEEYREWFESHKPNCTANHEGSSGKMEVDGVLEMFKSSVKKYKLKYKYYIGGGDCKVYSSISEAKPYRKNYAVIKKECVGHVQKRMGTQLRDLKKKLSGQVLSDKKPIGGQGRLTAQVIDQLTQYYGKAIRSNSTSASNMAKAIWAIFYHKSSTDKEHNHSFCPTGQDSWCEWQKAKATNTHKTYKHKHSLPKAIMEKIKPVFTTLSKPELLERCVGGYNQNSNESFNNCVWKLAPKALFSGMNSLSFACYLQWQHLMMENLTMCRCMGTFSRKPTTRKMADKKTDKSEKPQSQSSSNTTLHHRDRKRTPQKDARKEQDHLRHSLRNNNSGYSRDERLPKRRR